MRVVPRCGFVIIVNSNLQAPIHRIHIHLLGPPVGKKADIKRCVALLQDREKYQAVFNRVKEAENAGVSKSLKSSVLLKKPACSKKPIEQAFGIMERSMVDLKIMRGLCANGIPFNVLRNPHFQEMVSAINKAPDGYKPPSSEKARTVLLDECVRDVEKDLTPIKDTWYSQGVSIVSDGWSNVKHNPLINVLAVNSRGAMFMYAEDFSGVEKTGVEIADFLISAIESVGPTNVLSVVTDNAANCKAAGAEIEKVYRHIFWSPCCVHTLNLVFKDLAKELYWLTDTYKNGKNIVKYFLNHTHALAIFRENSKLELLKVAKTRFASYYILLRRLADCRESLAMTISLNSWRDWVKHGNEHTRSLGQSVAETIRSDKFWDDVESILAITKPIFLLIKFCDGEGTKMGEIYEKMDNMLGEIKDIMADNPYSHYYPDVEKIVLNRWEKMTIPLHCLGFALSPRFYDAHYLSQLAPGGIKRKAPNDDKEVVRNVVEAFKRIAENDEENNLLRKQFATFHMKKGLFALPAAHVDATTMDAIEWWSTYGSETPELAEVAKKVLSQPISSSSAERNWSTYSYIHSVKRNRLNNKRADKLVFVHSNIRLVSRFSESYKQGPYKKWDINPESSNLETSIVRLDDMQWESLYEDEADKAKGKRQRLD
ncbi:hypothetical protein CTI12_AA186260 [Artemisia annua]|uniref:Uncharacterized protein n=1 Tax=Artemisia annua TaxID=35608 RepID=A0A2U1P6W3_ARTAN|nr:hypothetical protein CTI12_AA186260 [Artemisia annua]